MKHQVVCMLVIILSVLGIFSCKAQDTAEPLSPLAKLLGGKEVIGYVYEGNLKLMDLDSQEEFNLISSGNVLDFCWNKSGDKIYAASIDSTLALSCLEYDLQNSSQKELYTRDLSTIPGYEYYSEGYVRPQDAGSDMYLNDRSEVITLFKGTGEPIVPRTFLIYNPATNALSQSAAGPIYLGENYGLPYWDASWFNPSLISQEETKDIINKKVGGIYELFINRAPAGSPPNYVRLTNTAKVPRELEYGAGDYKISFYVSPNQKVVQFFVVEGMGGDFGNPGSDHVINSDGTHQQQISSIWDFVWTSDDALVYYGEDPENDPEDYENRAIVLMKRSPDGTISTLKKFTQGGSLKKLHSRPRT